MNDDLCVALSGNLVNNSRGKSGNFMFNFGRNNEEALLF